MNMKKKLVVTLCAAILFGTGLANASEPIQLGSTGMVSPGQHDDSVSLKKLSDKRFYTITATIHNTNKQDVDYRISTSYAANPDGSLGNVTSDKGEIFTKDGENGYKSHLASTDQDIQITLHNVRPDHGIFIKDHLDLANITPSQAGSGIEMRNIVATEQPDSGAGPGDATNVSENNVQ